MLITEWKAIPCLDRTREEWLSLWGFKLLEGVWYSPDELKEMEIKK